METLKKRECFLKDIIGLLILPNGIQIMHALVKGTQRFEMKFFGVLNQF